MRTAVFSFAILPENSKPDTDKTDESVVIRYINKNEVNKLFVPINFNTDKNIDKLKVDTIRLVNKLFDKI